ncbi:hypothetical protein L1049_005005 [Liquidambar formosana]|uniref:Diacylglycerol O-acyltransferase 3 n=1 Tax=Liquidambar formosana TaxID=63359 RepID=A0AAP0RPX7_LIQFO
MEVAGIVSLPVMRFYGARMDTRFSNSCSCGLFVDGGNRFRGDLGLGSGDSLVSQRPRNFFGLSSSGYSNFGHIEYYASPKSEEKEKQKKKSSEMNTLKKKLKLIKRLSRDLPKFSHMASSGVETENSLMGEVKGKMISEAMEVLLPKLQQLRSEQKELKRKNKEKKAQLKTTLMKARAKCKLESSSSSSSESSDSECGEVINMSSMRGSDALKCSKDYEPQQAIQEAAVATPRSLIQKENSEQAVGIGEISLPNYTEECCSGTGVRCSNSTSFSNGQRSSTTVGSSAQRIEVCMGGKCKKLGALALLEEFERKVGVEGAVAGCKCMGKCRDGPNVRVLNQLDGIQAEKAECSVKPRVSPLCIGVGLEDVSVIVANFLGENRNDKHFMAPA